AGILQPWVTGSAAFICILAGPFLSILFEQAAARGFDHQLQAFHRAGLATLACYGVIVLVSLVTQRERDSENEQYTWGRFKRHGESSSSNARPWWQHDKLWAGVLIACTLGMCWFFR